MNKHLLYLIISLTLLVSCLILYPSFYAIFIISSIYLLFSWLSSIGSQGEVNMIPEYDGPMGVLDVYTVDIEDECFGLYLELFGKNVFLDIKEDKLLDKRKEIALSLFKKSKSLEKSINGYIDENPEFQKKTVDSLGLHSKDLSQIEVFWDPSGHTILTLE